MCGRTTLLVAYIWQNYPLGCLHLAELPFWLPIFGRTTLLVVNFWQNYPFGHLFLAELPFWLLTFGQNYAFVCLHLRVVQTAGYFFNISPHTK